MKGSRAAGDGARCHHITMLAPTLLLMAANGSVAIVSRMTAATELSPRTSGSNDEGLSCRRRTQRSAKFLSMVETVAAAILLCDSYCWNSPPALRH